MDDRYAKMPMAEIGATAARRIDGGNFDLSQAKQIKSASVSDLLREIDGLIDSIESHVSVLSYSIGGSSDGVAKQDGRAERQVLPLVTELEQFRRRLALANGILDETRRVIS